MERKNLTCSLAIALAATSARTLAEPYVSTTANRADGMASWWVWWCCLAAVSMVIYPALLHSVLRLLGLTPRLWHLLGLGLVHLATGATGIVLMIAVSIAYADTSPWVFVGAWLMATALISFTYVVHVRASAPTTNSA